MTSLGIRLLGLAQPVVRCTRAKIQTLFSRKYLLLTNTGICVALGTTGDFMQQRYEILCQRQKEWDPSRTKRICVTSLAIGPVVHYWYILLDAFFPGRKVVVVLKKILLDQIIFSPVNIVMFLFIMGMQEEITGKEMINDLKDKGKDLLVAEWIVWPPAQMVNFFLLPTRFRVLFDNIVSLGFDCYYSYVKFRKGKDDSPTEKGNDEQDTNGNWVKDENQPNS